ncbi:MAG: hypothetical protein HY390_03140 [Deltaproteobacteria bacterium]|nr:hypothetical protein [Deltaproteobacteria bacterium]
MSLNSVARLKWLGMGLMCLLLSSCAPGGGDFGSGDGTSSTGVQTGGSGTTSGSESTQITGPVEESGDEMEANSDEVSVFGQAIKSTIVGAEVRVLDADGNPVYKDGKEYVTYTDEKGHYDLSGLKRGEMYTVVVEGGEVHDGDQVYPFTEGPLKTILDLREATQSVRADATVASTLVAEAVELLVQQGVTQGEALVQARDKVKETFYVEKPELGVDVGRVSEVNDQDVAAYETGLFGKAVQEEAVQQRRRLHEYVAELAEKMTRGGDNAKKDLEAHKVRVFEHLRVVKNRYAEPAMRGNASASIDAWEKKLHGDRERIQPMHEDDGYAQQDRSSLPQDHAGDLAEREVAEEPTSRPKDDHLGDDRRDDTEAERIAAEDAAKKKADEERRASEKKFADEKAAAEETRKKAEADRIAAEDAAKKKKAEDERMATERKTKIEGFERNLQQLSEVIEQKQNALIAQEKLLNDKKNEEQAKIDRAKQLASELERLRGLVPRGTLPRKSIADDLKINLFAEAYGAFREIRMTFERKSGLPFASGKKMLSLVVPQTKGVKIQNRILTQRIDMTCGPERRGVNLETDRLPPTSEFFYEACDDVIIKVEGPGIANEKRMSASFKLEATEFPRSRNNYFVKAFETFERNSFSSRDNKTIRILYDDTYPAFEQRYKEYTKKIKDIDDHVRQCVKFTNHMQVMPKYYFDQYCFEGVATVERKASTNLIQLNKELVQTRNSLRDEITGKTAEKAKTQKELDDFKGPHTLQ